MQPLQVIYGIIQMRFKVGINWVIFRVSLRDANKIDILLPESMRNTYFSSPKGTVSFQCCLLAKHSMLSLCATLND